MRQLFITMCLCVLIPGCLLETEFVGIHCEAECLGSTPVCNEMIGECVECVGDSECLDASQPFCFGRSRCTECLLNTDCAGGAECVEGVCGGCRNSTECANDAPVCRFGECVGCGGDADCGGSTPLCDTAAGTCGECVDDNDCTLGVCGAGECVECVDNSDCTGIEPRCNTSTNRCEGCMSSADCGGATPTCDVPSGRCGACTPSTEAAACGGNSCSATTLTCTTTVIGSVPSCGDCLADSDCSQAQGTARCVETQYMGASDGYHCLLAAPGCMRPFSSTVDGVSISGVAEASYCTVSPSLTTCNALVALRTSVACPGGSAAECGATASTCSTVSAIANLCSYPCSIAVDCPGVLTCNAGTCGS